MSKGYDAKRVINGTYGEVWIDDYYLAEVTGLEAKATIEKSEVNQAGKLGKSYKMTGIDYKGTVKFYKVTSYFTVKVVNAIKEGKMPTCTLISKLADPDSTGAERIKLTGVVFDEVSLANWENKKLGEESVPFSFEDFELLDTIPAMNTSGM